MILGSNVRYLKEQFLSFLSHPASDILYSAQNTWQVSKRFCSSLKDFDELLTITFSGI